MESWGRELIDLWLARTPALGVFLKEAVDLNPDAYGKYSLEDCEQMMRAGAAMIEEDLAGTGNDTKDAYLQTVIPGALAQGTTLSSLAAIISLVAIKVNTDLIPRMKPEHRERGGMFLAQWYARWIGLVVAAGLETGARS
jgi:hypothetical protein